MLRFILWIPFVMFLYDSVHAQIESTGVILPTLSNTNENNTLSSNTPNINSDFSLPEIDQSRTDFRKKDKPWSMSLDQGFFEPTLEFTPKAFTKEKEIKESYKSDQYLGDFKSTSAFVNLIYRDHQTVDGDMVRIYLNNDVIRSEVFLSAGFQGFTIDLNKGFNKIDIEALNQGESGPNTAEFRLYNDEQELVTANEWNLTTGVKATIIIVKP